MSSYAIVNARILTLNGFSEPRRGEEMSQLNILNNANLIVDENVIESVSTDPLPKDFDSPVVDADNRILMPTFVDCHTHACWDGSRLDEFESTLKGEKYLDILKNGGGILSTVKAVRESTEEILTNNLLENISMMLMSGTGSIEVKSGYGLTLKDELKMLGSIHEASLTSEADITGTFLGAHTKDPENNNFVYEMIEEILPSVVQEFPNIPCDAYLEENAWNLKEIEKLFKSAYELGCPLRLHTDQFNELGGVDLAIEMNAKTVDHLEASSYKTLKRLAKSSTIGVALPSSGFHLDDRYMKARTFIDEGGALAIATNCNPGSSPNTSMPFTLNIASRKLKLNAAECIVGSTWNAACALGIEGSCGSLEKGKRADFQLLDFKDERELTWRINGGQPVMVVCNGRISFLSENRLQSDESEEE